MNLCHMNMQVLTIPFLKYNFTVPKKPHIHPQLHILQAVTLGK